MSCNLIFFYICFSFYILTAGFLAAYLVTEKEELFSYCRQWLFVASLAGVFFLVIRYRELAHLPLVSLFEITFFYAWVIGIFYLIFIKKNMARFIKVLGLLIIYAILIWNVFLDKRGYPLNPLLRSFWLGIHVPAAIFSYAAFALAFVISIYYLYAKKRGQAKECLETANSNLITFGVILLGIGIFTGAVWAKSAWGRFWSWDPKETWALITFLIYAGVILIRRLLKSSYAWQAMLSILGFVAVLFTFFGVNLIITSHHSY
jgi:ABC-type transport system involved in cytochrome c biogenesis permease subunit